MRDSTRRHRLVAVATTAALVFLAGCAATLPPLVLVPDSSPSRAVYYQRGTPFAEIRRDSVLALVSCEATKLFGHRYLRVWLLYLNRSRTPILIDPLRQVSLVCANRRSLAYKFSNPELPYRLLSKAETQRQIDLVFTAIGGGLRAAAVSARNTEMKTTGTLTGASGENTHISTSTTITDAGEKAAAKAREIGEETRASLWDINEAYTTFEKSLNAGVLRKHTVFPGGGVNGFLYLPLVLWEHRVIPGNSFVGATDYLVAWAPEDVRYTLKLSLPMLADTVCFIPEAGD